MAKFKRSEGHTLFIAEGFTPGWSRFEKIPKMNGENLTDQEVDMLKRRLALLKVKYDRRL